MPDAGRVITGSAGGRRLEAPGPATRPFSDKVKQALFSMVEAGWDDVWDHPVLDLFAGSGAIGIEALSRGARSAVFVERDRRTASVIERNLERTDLAANARVVRADVADFLASVPLEAPFGLVVIDPPYDRHADLRAALDALGTTAAGWLDPDALVVAKHFWKDRPPEQAGELVRERERRFGETALSVYRPSMRSARAA